jgi:TetR/AcrR family transcriptional regulator, mexJK operon transcriptional repressor
MDMIAREAGASKETLYRHFGRKEDLFAEVVSNRARLLREGLDANFDRPHAMEAVLYELGVSLLTHISKPEVLCLLRLVIAEAPRDPALGSIFFTHGPERTRLRLAEYLDAAGRRGEFRGKPSLAATIFLSAVIGSQHLLRMTVSDPPPMSAAEIDERVSEVVALFMTRYAA